MKTGYLRGTVSVLRKYDSNIPYKRRGLTGVRDPKYPKIPDGSGKGMDLRLAHPTTCSQNALRQYGGTFYQDVWFVTE
jgi:hypothetical protein